MKISHPPPRSSQTKTLGTSTVLYLPIPAGLADGTSSITLNMRAAIHTDCRRRRLDLDPCIPPTLYATYIMIVVTIDPETSSVELLGCFFLECALCLPNLGLLRHLLVDPALTMDLVEPDLYTWAVTAQGCNTIIDVCQID